jgi:hypothetical protein
VPALKVSGRTLPLLSRPSDRWTSLAKSMLASIDVLWLAKSLATWFAGSGSVGLFVWNDWALREKSFGTTERATHGISSARLRSAFSLGWRCSSVRIQCVGETKVWPKGPTGSCGGPESLHLTGATRVYHAGDCNIGKKLSKTRSSVADRLGKDEVPIRSPDARDSRRWNAVTTGQRARSFSPSDGSPEPDVVARSAYLECDGQPRSASCLRSWSRSAT